MKNFEFSSLILINPKCRVGIEARKVAKHAQNILNNAKLRSQSHLKTYDYLIGTTAILGRDYNLPRNPLDPEQCAKKLATTRKNKIGILIGRESSGLTNEEIKACDMLVSIPASKKYPTMNVSHALAILLYEINRHRDHSISHIVAASKKEKSVMQRIAYKIINGLDFETEEKRETQKLVWRRIIGKSLMTRREAFVFMGFFRKLEDRIKRNSKKSVQSRHHKQ